MTLARLRDFLMLGLVAVFSAAEALAQVSTNQTNTLVRFRILTNTRLVGEMDVELFDRDKPETVGNFLNYVTNGAYANSIIHRCIPGFVLQGGALGVSNPYSPAFLDLGALVAVPTNAPITNEYSVGPTLSNVFGTIAMARLPGETNSATASWFFNLANNASLNTNDGGFTVFGRVKTGSSLLTFFNRPSASLGLVQVPDLFDSFPLSYRTSRDATVRDLFQVQIHVLNPADKIRPALTLTKPVNGARVTNEMTISGISTDLGGVASIEVLINDLPMRVFPAPPTNRWSLTLTNLPAGTNYLTVQLVDASGQRSLPVSRYCFNVVRAPFLFLSYGPGSVPGLTNCQIVGTNCVVVTNIDEEVVEGMTNLVTTYVTNCTLVLTNCTLLEIGRGYTFTARPPPGHIVVWTNEAGFYDEFPYVSFIMPSNASLAAVFIPNPFLALQGTYHGLILTTNGVAHQQSGYLTLTLNSSGRYSCSARINGRSVTFSWAFDHRLGFRYRSDFAPRVPGTVGDLYYFLLRLDVSNGTQRITGRVDNLFQTDEAPWISPIVADRVWWHSRTNKAPFAGKYTVALDVPQDTDPRHSPGGNSYATATATTAGLLTMAGVLADNTPFSFSAPVSPSYQWPFHPIIYGGRGSLIGWVNLLTNDVPTTNNPVEALEGQLNWFKPPRAGPVYTNGFSVTNVMLAGSSYPNVVTNRLLLQETNLVEFRGGYQPASWTNIVRLGPNNLVTNTSTNSLVFTISKPNGLFTGTVKAPGSARSIPFRGVTLTNRNAGYGFFVDTNVSGQVFVGPPAAPPPP